MKKLKRLFKVVLFSLSLLYIIPTFIIAKICKLFIKDLWLISENGDYARDNGFVFFKFLREFHPEQRCVYVITKNSSDLEKVKSIGKVCYFKKISHVFYYFLCSKNISSHPYCSPFILSTNYLIWSNKHYFLQHGVTKDMTSYTRKKYRFKLFCTTSPIEQDFIINYYGFGKHVVKITGFARYDNLLKPVSTEKQILIMPTWRAWLVHLSTEEFTSSSYYKYWQSLINNKSLINFAKENNYTILFYPHHHMQQYLDYFKVDNDVVKIASIDKFNIQDTMKQSSMLITDYSSVAFDFAYMLKPVVFYCFDYDEFASKHHKIGYFDYLDNFIGNSYQTEQDVIDEIVKTVNKNCKITQFTKENIEKFFPVRDTKNCERIYNAIKNKNA